MPCVFILKDKNKAARTTEMTSLANIVLTAWHIWDTSCIIYREPIITRFA